MQALRRRILFVAIVAIAAIAVVTAQTEKVYVTHTGVRAPRHRDQSFRRIAITCSTPS